MPRKHEDLLPEAAKIIEGLLKGDPEYLDMLPDLNEVETRKNQEFVAAMKRRLEGDDVDEESDSTGFSQCTPSIRVDSSHGEPSNERLASPLQAEIRHRKAR